MNANGITKKSTKGQSRKTESLVEELTKREQEIRDLEKKLDDSREERIAAEEALGEVREAGEKRAEELETQIRLLKSAKQDMTNNYAAEIKRLKTENQILSEKASTFEGKASFFVATTAILGAIAIGLIVALIL